MIALLLALSVLLPPAEAPPIGARWASSGGAVVTYAGPGCVALDGGWGGPRPIPGACSSAPGWYDLALPGPLVSQVRPGDAFLLLDPAGAVLGRAALPDRHNLALPLLRR